MKKNNGQIPQYYVEESHPAIISPEIYDAVQAELERRGKGKGRYSGVDILSSKIVCGDCGWSYSPKVWHSTDNYRRVIYQCGHKYKKGNHRCSTPHFTAEEIHQIFITAVNDMLKNKNEIIANLRESLTVISTDELEAELAAAKKEMLLLAGMVENLVTENAHTAQDQIEYNQKYDALIDRYEAAKSHYEDIEKQITAVQNRVRSIESFIKNVRKLGVVTEFDEELWGLLVDRITVYSKEDVRVEFKK